ncbi:hypothetical protein [Methanosarcina horonobensis]|uniref:hypothetical protein n=1 Tax=Methanosarcina horonobensis TaxID=418008 RepID=UPI000A45B244|nr:hypothetical protein [Methanosarcina horonobensis]
MELPAAIILFVIFTAVIGTEGTRLSKTADQFADLTGLGEALVGGVLIGSIDSPAGAITSITAAYENHPSLQSATQSEGILAQTKFLALADISYKKANLEHAAASYPNLMQGTLLMIIGYIAGIRMIWEAEKRAMWVPKSTTSTYRTWFCMWKAST